MHFGMGEDFQFSRPYKWRYSKLFHRLFVYCSRLLIARDNSTGFTIQWGICTPKRWFNYPRAFWGSTPPVGVWLSNGKSARGIEANSYNNSGANLIESAGGTCANANSIAYIVVGFSWFHVIIPRDLQLRGWWLMQTPEAALVFQEVFLPLNLFKGRLFQTLVVPPKTMKTVLAAIQIHP